MAFSLSSPVTGAAQTSLTSPTQTVIVDNAPAVNAKQWYVSALGGTQTGVSISSQSAPFTICMFRPVSFTPVGRVNNQGILVNNGYNTFAVVVRKGMLPLAGQAPQTAIFTLSMKVPAGADLASPAEIRGALSLMFGALSQQSAGIGDSLISGAI